nr:MAG TPA: hypothetical protein [Caudoviricetes sp.]
MLGHPQEHRRRGRRPRHAIPPISGGLAAHPLPFPRRQ